MTYLVGLWGGLMGSVFVRVVVGVVGAGVRARRCGKTTQVVCTETRASVRAVFFGGGHTRVNQCEPMWCTVHNNPTCTSAAVNRLSNRV